MTFDQAKEAFREHKTCESADAYLHNAVHHKAADLIGAQALFNAVGEVASWLAASDQQLQSFEAVKASAAYLAQIVQEVALQAQIIRFPIERCRPRSSGGIETLMLAPMAFYLTMTGMFLSPVASAERSKPVTDSDDRIGSKTNVYRL